ncbi:MAG: hypothetical protein EA359_18050, partial [Balneolaceae bacterium]
MNSLYKYLIVLPLIAACFLIANAQEIQAQSDDKTFRYFTPQDGYPAFVFRIQQGDDGKIWMSSPSGLFSFDGYEPHVYMYDPSDNNSIPEGNFRVILNDNNGHLWLTGPNVIALYDFQTEEFSEVSIPDNLPPYQFANGLTQTADSIIWIGSITGIYRLTIPTSVRPKPDVSYIGIDELEDQANRVTDIIEGPDGQIWISSNEGLYFLDPETGSYVKAGPFNQIPNGADFYDFSYIVMDNDNTVWVSLDGGLLKFTEGENEPEFLTFLGEENFSLAGLQVNFMTLSGDGSIWIATRASGALQYDPSTNKLTQFKSDTGNRESISENFVYNVFEDMDGNTWFGHIGNGISMMYEKAWNYTYKKIIEADDPNATSNFIHEIKPDDNGNSWVLTSLGLAFIPADGGPNQIFLPESEGSESNNRYRFLSILFAGDDGLFFIERNSEAEPRLHPFDRKEQLFTGFQAIDPSAYLDSFMSDGTTLYWTERGKNKLMMLNTTDMSTTYIDLPLAFPVADSNADTTIYVKPFVSKSGNLYLQYNYELQNEPLYSKRLYFKLDSDRQSFSGVPILSPESERPLKMSRTTIVSQLYDGVFWTMTNNGLLKENLIEGTSSLIIARSAPRSLMFGFVLEDHQGNIWYSDYGTIISKLDPITQREQSFVLDMNRKPYLFFTAAELSGGEIIAGGPGGYIQFNPAEIREEINIQKLYIDEFRTGSTSYTNLQPGMEYEIEYEDNNLSFSFAGINYRHGNNRYRYRLLGYDDQWTDLGMQRSISFANLPFGSYNFQVQATRSGTSFSENSAAAEVQFAILPPWWRTTFAYLLYFLLFGGIVFGIDRIQRKRLIQKERERATAKELEQAKEIEKAYKNLEAAHESLKSAQDQLIQQEKLASLGQLTAGIAHE